MTRERQGGSSSGGSGCGCGGGLGAGGVVAFIISWKLWHSIWWALLAALFGWGYVLYAAIYYLDKIRAWLG